MRRLALAFACASLLLLALGARADEGREFVPPKLRLVHLVDGLRSQPKNRNLERTKETKLYKLAKAAGVDLEEPSHPLVAQQFEEGRLFYVFFKLTEGSVGDRPYLIQRIRKTERTWATVDQEEPDVRTTYQVEVFKTFAGAMKRADQHHGSYGLGEHHRREILKEYEIGFGAIPGVCEGTDWPFDSGRLFEYVQRYQEEAGVYPKVAFLSSTPWTLHVGFDDAGNHFVRCPELGIDAPKTLPAPESALPAADPSTKDTVLEAGKGADGFVAKVSTLDDLIRRYGDPVQSQTWSSGSANHWFGRGLVFNLHIDDTVNTVQSLPGFAGRTKAGIRHSDHRARALEVMGMPAPTTTNAWTWKYDGILFYFDGFDRVSRIVVFAK